MIKPFALTNVPITVDTKNSSPWENYFLKTSHEYISKKDANDVKVQEHIATALDQLEKENKHLMSSSGITVINPGNIVCVYLVGKCHIEYISVFHKRSLREVQLLDILN